MKIKSAEFSSATHLPGRYPPASLPEIAFAGRSNVGKSSLLNALLGRNRLARTSRTPGRTQAIQFYLVNGRFFFVDLPGYGYARIPLEIRRRWRPLIEGYIASRAVLRGVIVILDARRAPAEGDVELLAYLAHHQVPAVVVLTKADKLSRNRLDAQRAAILRSLAEHPSPLPRVPIAFSSVTGLGTEELWGWIRDRLGA